MALADRDAPPSARMRNTRILTIDIERLPGQFTADFWDLNAFKGRRIHPDMVTEWPRTICVAWKWRDRAKVHFASEWGDGMTAMLTAAWEAYDQADIVQGHNVDRFDTRKLNAEWNDLGLPPPSPVKFVDTLKIARSTFGYESNTLAAITDRLCIETKTDKYDIATAKAAVKGDKAAQRKIKAYNIGDIHASEALADRLRGWIPNHPVLGQGDDLACNQCGSTDLERNGWHRAVVQEYARYKCRACGANVRSSHMKRVSATRGIR